MSTTPGGPQYSGFPEPSTEGEPKRSNRARILAIAGAVIALVAAVAIGSASVSRETVQPSAAPAPVTVTAKPSTVTKTATVTPAPVTVTATPATVTAPPVSVTATVTEAAAGPTATIKNGISLVGVDIQPGTYRSDNEDCYWARLSGTSGSFNDIIANSNGATVVTIDSSDHAFESRRCSPWTQVG